MVKILIRQARPSELPRIKFITKLAYKAAYKGVTFITKPHESAEEDERFTQKKIFILTAVMNDKIVGAVRYKFNKPDDLYFFKLVVLKTYRGCGIGAALIKELEKISKKKAVKKISLDCAQEKRLDEYYEKFGFKTDKIEAKANHHLVYMSKNI